MPRIREPDFEERRRIRWSVIESWKIINDKNAGALAKLWGVSGGTISNKKTDPGSITIEQIRLLRLPDEQILKIVKGG